MAAILPIPSQATSLSSKVEGLAEHGNEPVLKELVQLTSMICAAPVALRFVDTSGTWFQTRAGFPERAEEGVGSPQSPIDPEERRALSQVVPLMDEFDRGLGFLEVVSPGPHQDPGACQANLKALAERIQFLVGSDQAKVERRASPRGPSGASFVPGLAHELRNFIFAISASLDAFEARFAAEVETSKYGMKIRTSLDRLNAFVEELQEYGDPRVLVWKERPMEPLLKEAIEHHAPKASRLGVELRLNLQGPLPGVRADERTLRLAFLRLIDLLLQQEQAGGRVELHAATRVQGERTVVFGHLESSSLKLTEIDFGRLFEPFYYRASGLGRLALPVARRIFEAHGGNLSASHGDQGGLRIGFMLPAA